MRHANEKHCVFRRVRRSLMKGTPGMLFKYVINVLQARDVALANAICPFVKPADRRTERDAVITNLAVGF